MLLRRGLFSLASSLFVITSLYPQTADRPDSPNPDFQSNVKVVLVDVAVADRNDQPIAGLKKEDFQILEKGRPQTIASFEEHKGLPPSQSGTASNQSGMASNKIAIPLLPPHFYTNYPLASPTDSVNVLVLDSLNTEISDQSTVRTQMISYLKNIQPGPRLAIFTLTSRMRMVEGFTADPSALLAALNNKNFGSGPHSSPVLRTKTEDNADEQLLNEMATVAKDGQSAQLSASIAALEQFMDETKNFQTYSRVQATLQALQQLGRYLAGFPGRKNVIWFSGSFPLSILPTKGQDYDFNFSEEFKSELTKTTNMLAAAQVAIYPVAAAGLDTSYFYTASNTYDPHIAELGLALHAPVGSNLQGQAAAQDEITDMQKTSQERAENQATMDEIAKDTGGEAFYNTNGLKDALAQIVSSGSHYYTISYTPTDKNMDGSYRPIVIKMREGHYKLAYRRGYFADSVKQATVKATKEEATKDQAQSAGDPLQPLMGRGMPDSTQILYKIRVLPSDHQPDTQSKVTGDNINLKGPVTRYAVDFAISPQDLHWAMTPDGMHNGNLEVTLVAYDQDGKTLNWLVRSMNMSLKPQLFAAFEQGGVQLHEEIDVPKEDVFLRTGILRSGYGQGGNAGNSAG
jgi:VWFA-related protein